MYTFPDISNWQTDIFADYPGYTRKIGKISPDGTRYMVKFEKKHTFKGVPMNIFMQHINSRIIAILGYPVQETFLASCDDYCVVCCKNFVPENAKLITFDVFLRTLYAPHEVTDIPDLEQLQHVLNTDTRLLPHKDMLYDFFWDMFTLDLFIGNVERTCSDFGYIISQNHVTPAPLFDNRSPRNDMAAPLTINNKLALYDDLLHTNLIPELHDAIIRILPVIEEKLPEIQQFICSQEYLSDGQKNFIYQNLTFRFNKLQLSERIRQVSATMAIENMPLAEQCYENLQAIGNGEKTVEQVVDEITHRYTTK